MRRPLLAVSSTLVFLLLMAPVALAGPHDGGQGTYGEVDDKVTTNAGFIVIGAIPLFILMMSLLQWRLEKRKYARKAAAAGRADNQLWKGGW